MGTTLTGTRISDTYDSLLKATDNGIITSSAKQITDGVGNNTPLYISTSRIGIGVSPTTTFQVSGNSKIGGDLTVTGNLLVEGTTTTVDTDTLSVKDPLIIVGNDNNTSDLVDLGFYGLYDTSGSQDLYAGLYRSASDTKFHLFKDLQEEPTTTVNTSGTGYAVASLVANLEGNVLGNLTGDVTGDITGNVTATSVLADGVTATTQSADDNSTKVATTAYVKSLDNASDLDFSTNNGNGVVNLNTQELQVLGTTNQIITTGSNQNITLSFPTAGVTLPDGSVATTQSALDNSTKVATTAYVDALEVSSTLSEILANGNTSGANDIIMADLQSIYFGTDSDFQLSHNNSGNSFIQHLGTGTLFIRNNTAEQVIKLQAKNSIDVVNDYVIINGETERTEFGKDVEIKNGNELYFHDALEIWHNSGNSNIINNTGDLIITQKTDDGDIIFKSDNGSGDVTEYFRVDGGDERVIYGRSIQMADNVSVYFGNDTADDGYIKWDSTANELFVNGPVKVLETLDVVGNSTFADDVTISSQLTVGASSSTDAPTIKAISASTAENILLEGTDDSASSAPDLVLYRNAGATSDNDTLGVVEFRGRNSDDSGVKSYSGIFSRIIDASEQKGALSFSVNAGNYVNAMAIHNTGTDEPKVIIGNTDAFAIPTDTLDVDGTLNVSGNSTFAGETYFNKGVRFYRYTDQANFWSVYTNTDNSLRFNYNGAGNDEITIDSSGNVGIGTDNPSGYGSKLVVNDSGTGLYINNGGGTATIKIADAGVSEYSITLPDGTGDFAISKSSSERMRIDSSGNVGIGTTSPDKKVEISGAGGSAILRLTSTDNVVSTGESLGSIEWQSNDGSTPGGTGTQGIINVVDDNSYGNAYSMTFTTANGGTLTEKMRIDSSGKVGIGTTSPDEKLDVENGNIRIKSNSDGNTGILRMYDAAGTESAQIYPAAGDLRFYTPNDIIMSPVGSVGIGTTSPQTLLNVNSLSGTTYPTLGTASGVIALSINELHGMYLGVDGASGNGWIQAMREDASATAYNLILQPSGGKVGIGTTSPSRELDVENSADNAIISAVSSTTHIAGLVLGDTADDDKGGILYNNTSDYLYFLSNGSERMRLTSGGDLHVDGDVVAYSTTISDKRLKDNVKPLESSLDKVMNLKGVEYVWNNGSRKGQKDIGFIAQEVEDVIPEIVREKQVIFNKEEKYKTVDYEKITAVLVEAVKELTAKVERLENNKCNCK